MAHISCQYQYIFDDNFETLTDLLWFAHQWPLCHLLRTMTTPPFRSFPTSMHLGSSVTSMKTRMSHLPLHHIPPQLAADEGELANDGCFEPIIIGLVPLEPEEETFPAPDLDKDAPPLYNPPDAMANKEGDMNCTQGAPVSFQICSDRNVRVSDKVLNSSKTIGSINPEYSTRLAITHLCSFFTTMLDDYTSNHFHLLVYAALLADKDRLTMENL
jgi:hypothetical protein